jgi:hypothetical protein
LKRLKILNKRGNINLEKQNVACHNFNTKDLIAHSLNEEAPGSNS